MTPTLPELREAVEFDLAGGTVLASPSRGDGTRGLGVALELDFVDLRLLENLDALLRGMAE